jgi:hypothetical protein
MMIVGDCKSIPQRSEFSSVRRRSKQQNRHAEQSAKRSRRSSLSICANVSHLKIACVVTGV